MIPGPLAPAIRRLRTAPATQVNLGPPGPNPQLRSRAGPNQVLRHSWGQLLVTGYVTGYYPVGQALAFAIAIAREGAGLRPRGGEASAAAAAVLPAAAAAAAGRLCRSAGL